MLSRERFFCSLKKLVFEFNIRDTPMEEQSSDDRQIGEKGDEVRGASAADSQRPEDDNWEGKSDCTSENEADESGSEDGDCDGPSAEENGKGDFERKNGLVPGSRPMKCLETASLTPDEDGLSMGMCNTSGLRDTQRMELKYCAREGHIARRSVLHGEGGKGDDFNSLVLAKLFIAPSLSLRAKSKNKKMRGQRKRISKRIDQNCCGLLSAVAAGGSGDLIA